MPTVYPSTDFVKQTLNALTGKTRPVTVYTTDDDMEIFTTNGKATFSEGQVDIINLDDGTHLRIWPRNILNIYAGMGKITIDITL